MISKSVLKLIALAVFLFLCQGCPSQNKQSQWAQENSEKKESSINNGSVVQNQVELLRLKQVAGILRFTASIEREILKIIRPELTMTNTQFEILSTVFDQHLGTKKNFGLIDCKLYEIQNSADVFKIYKLCQKPNVLVATLSMKNNNLMTIQFLTKEWASVVGQSVALILPDRVCQISFESEKVHKMTCEHTAFVVSTDPEIQELRLAEFIFDQKAAQQVQVLGGYYKNLVEHRKLKLNIPFDGKIKIIEKELKVRDDFIDIKKQQTEKSEYIQSIQPEVNSGKKNIENSGENSEDEKTTENEDDSNKSDLKEESKNRSN